MISTHLPDAIMVAIGAAHTSTAELCEAAGITPKRMDKILANGGDMLLTEVAAIANALNVPIKVLVVAAEQMAATA